ncbi:hypothetical protein [Sphingomonas radiodurans]|uniref:hypothetical protein n=1 Tax=Sphingomonas radiodurans TaxID=2890321 RepID=UPI001E63AE8A|nr:hypothetical protein [Sphingomonas radiodurans]WBH17048.1 hypothetical protein LLW23_02700 [Sphingomonas radiodurans]
MKWLKRTAIGALVALALIILIGTLAPQKYRDEAARRSAAEPRVAAPAAAPRLPEWVKSVDRSGPVMTVTIDISTHPKDQLVGTLGRRILQLAEEHREGRFPIPSEVNRVLIHGDVALFDQSGAPTGLETALRASFPKGAFVAAAHPAQNFWTVFKLADHTNQTRVSEMNDLLGDFCITDFGAQTGDLCLT